MAQSESGEVKIPPAKIHEGHIRACARAIVAGKSVLVARGVVAKISGRSVNYSLLTGRA